MYESSLSNNHSLKEVLLIDHNPYCAKRMANHIKVNMCDHTPNTNNNIIMSATEDKSTKTSISGTSSKCSKRKAGGSSGKGISGKGKASKSVKGKASKIPVIVIDDSDSEGDTTDSTDDSQREDSAANDGLPQHWCPIPEGKDFILVEVDNGTAEYVEIWSEFLNSVDDASEYIVKVSVFII